MDWDSDLDSESSLESRYDPDKYPDIPAELLPYTNTTRAMRGGSDDCDSYAPSGRSAQMEIARHAGLKRQGFPSLGPRSLGAMATAVLAKNADQLSVEHVRELSDDRREALKKAIVGSCDLSAKLWRILLPRKKHTLSDPGSSPAAAVAPTAMAPAPATTAAMTTATATASASSNARSVINIVTARTHMFCSQVRTPTNKLGPYIESLTAPSMEFAAHIRIMACSRADFDYYELLKLASMPNLGILEIIEINYVGFAFDMTYEPPLDKYKSRHEESKLKSAQVNDKLMRGWCSAKPVPFPELRVLRLRGCMSQTLSQRCLEYAAAFPKLAYFELSVDRIYVSDERSRKPGPGFEDGPRGAWSQVHGYAKTYGWHGFQYDKDSFGYTSDDRISPVRISNKQPRLTLNMVERDSTPMHAANWGGRIYSFAADRGFRDKQDSDAIIGDIRHVGPSDAFPITHNIASLSLGVDRAIKSYRNELGLRGNFTFVFVRTTEQLQAQVEANQKHREALAERKSRMAAERRAQAKAHRAAAKAAKEAGLPEPVTRKAPKRAASAPDPEPPRKLRGPISIQEMLKISEENAVLEEAKRLARNEAARAKRQLERAARLQDSDSDQ